MSKKYLIVLLIVLLVLSGFANISAQTRTQTQTGKKPPVRSSTKPAVAVTPEPAIAKTPEQEKRLKSFNTVWQTIKDNYFDQTFNGLNWDAIRREYEPRVLKAASSFQFHSLLQEMINRLNRSHFVIVPPEVYQELEKAKEKVKESDPGAKDESGNENANDAAEDKDAANFLLDDAEAEFGVGIDIRVINSQTVITNVEKGSSAERAGLKPGYVIDKVNGVSLNNLLQSFMVSGAYGKLAEKMFPLEVLNYFINGQKESSVKIGYLDEKDVPRETTVKREKLNGKLIKAVPNFPKEFFSFESRSLNDDTAYIKFNMFAMPAVEGMCRALNEFKNKKAVIIDMRGNVGGSIGALIGITGMLIDKPLTLGTQIYKNSRENVAVSPQGRKFGGKLIVLIDSLSYSAAEIFAGGLQENGRLTVVGEKSAGQALPSTTIQLATGALFMYPFANFQTPKGYSIEGKGVEPDVKIPRERKALLAGKDAQLDAAIALSSAPSAEPVKVAAREKSAGGKGVPPVPALKARPNGAFKTAPGIDNTNSIRPKLEPKYDPEAMNAIKDFITVSGGEDAIKKLTSYSAKGTVEISRAGAKVEGAFEIYDRLPGQETEVMTIESVGVIRSIFDGKTYFLQSDIMGNSEYSEAAQVEEMKLFSDLHEMLKIKDLYRQVTYLGEYQRKGKTARMVKAVTEDGVEMALAFDDKTKFLMQRVGTFTNTSYDDYRKVGDVMLPFWQTRSDSLIIKLREYKLNVPLEDSIFVPKDNCFTAQDKLEKEEKP
jgi:carboxyl-terminal processing protease